MRDDVVGILVPRLVDLGLVGIGKRHIPCACRRDGDDLGRDLVPVLELPGRQRRHRASLAMPGDIHRRRGEAPDPLPFDLGEETVPEKAERLREAPVHLAGKPRHGDRVGVEIVEPVAHRRRAVEIERHRPAERNHDAVDRLPDETGVDQAGAADEGRRWGQEAGTVVVDISRVAGQLTVTGDSIGTTTRTKQAAVECRCRHRKRAPVEDFLVDDFDL